MYLEGLKLDKQKGFRSLCPRARNSFDLCNPEVTLRLAPCTLEPALHVRSMPKKRIILKLYHHAAWKALHNNAFESEETSLAVVLQHLDPRTLGEVEMAETVCALFGVWSPSRTATPSSRKGRIAEVCHRGIFSTSLNMNCR